VRTGEFGHDEPATALIADQTPEYSISNTRHGR
jgi:hypothetical protein